MVNLKTIIIAIITILTGVLAYYLFFSSEEARIKKQFDSFAEAVDKKPDETRIASIAKIKQLKELFAQEIRVDAPAHSFTDVLTFDELAAIILGERERYAKITVKFHQYTIEFPDDHQAAVNVTASLAGQTSAGLMTEDLWVLDCRLSLLDRIWRFEKIDIKSTQNT